jgi:hypothetical protein
MKTLIYLLFLLPAGAASIYGQSAQPAYPPLAPAPPFVPPTVQGLCPAWQGLYPTPHLLPLHSPGNNPLRPDYPLLPGYQLDIAPGSPSPQVNFLMSRKQIRILQPDNMPCLTPDLSRLERMPVKRTKSADRMPNAIKSAK